MKGLNLKPVKPPKDEKPPRCEDCKNPLIVSRGWGFCETCWRGESLPIGIVVSRGSQEGKEVHLLSTIRRELEQDGYEGLEDDIEDELRSRKYIVIRDLEFRK